MKSQIVEYLRLKAATIGGVNTHLGIHELRTNGNGQSVPYAYVGGDNLQPLDIDNGSVGYFRTYQREEFTPVDGMRAERDLSGTFYIRYAAILHRDTRDHAAYAEDVANAFTGFNSDLKSILKAKRVNITRSSIETDISRAWREEFSVPVTDLPYNLAMVFVDVTVTVVGSRDCWQGCSEQYDILQGFDWCNPATVQRLTEAQRDCIRGFLPTPCEPATYTLDNTDGTELSTGSIPSAGSAVIVAPDGNIELNGTPVGVVASGDTTDIPIIQDGSPAGSWNGTQWVIPSCPAGGVSISVTVSDNNPNVGQTITITATPSAGYSPTNYLFLARQNGTIIEIANGASNVVNWTVTIIGTFDIIVQAVESTDKAWNDEGVTANAIVVLNGIQLWLDPLRSGIVAPNYPDLSGFGRDGTLVNSPTVIEGSLAPNDGGYIGFNGIDQSISVGGVADFSFIQNTVQFTVMGFVYFNDVSLRNFFAGNANASTQRGFGFVLDTANYGAGGPQNVVKRLLFSINRGVSGISNIRFVMSQDNVITSNGWHHIAVTMNGLSTAQLYVNGTPVTTNEIGTYTTLPTGNSSEVLTIGRVASLFFSGRISPFQIYNRALSPAEVEQNFDADKARYGL